LSGEWGYASHRRGVSLEIQAAFLARQQLVNFMSGIPVSIWYDWKNDGTNPEEREENFGTVMADLRPKPAYAAVKALTTELGGCTFERRLKLGGPEDYLLCFRSPAGHQKLAGWSTQGPREITVIVRRERGAKVAVGVRTSGGHTYGVTQEGGALGTLHSESGSNYVELTGGLLKWRLDVAPQYLNWAGLKLETGN
jgi:hypothetical protein